MCVVPTEIKFRFLVCYRKCTNNISDENKSLPLNQSTLPITNKKLNILVTSETEVTQFSFKFFEDKKDISTLSVPWIKYHHRFHIFLAILQSDTFFTILKLHKV